MSSSSADNCSEEEGLDYIFARMSAIYGGAFVRHWDGIDPRLVRQTWQDVLGRCLTYRPLMDYALSHMDPDFPPSALRFREICQKGPAVPRPGQQQLAHDPSQPISAEAKRRGIEALERLQRNWKGMA